MPVSPDDQSNPPLSPADYELIATAAAAAAPKPAPVAAKSDKDNLFAMWTRPFTVMHKIQVFKRVWFYLFMLAAYVICVDQIVPSVTTKIFKEAGLAGTYSSVVLGLLLVFPTNSAYDRWWEGRKLWGQLTNDSRNICLKVSSMVAVSESEKRQFGEMVISFAYALKHHLRDSTPTENLPGLTGLTASDLDHLPLTIANRIYQTIAKWQVSNKIDGLTFIILDQHARALMDICGACERIKNSPISVSYRAFMRQGIALSLLTMPWYLSREFPIWYSLPPFLVGAYFLIGIELIAEDVEDPFGHDGDDLPLDNMCNGIRHTCSKVLPVSRDQRFTTTISKPRIDLLKTP